MLINFLMQVIQVRWNSPTIFLSYRRKDTDGHTGRLFTDLVNAFSKRNVFFDIDTLKAGEKFGEVIEKAIGSCDALVAVIGRNWLTIAEAGVRRIDDPEDYVRREIAAALKRNVAIIPVLVQGAMMPDEKDLPEELQPLSGLHAAEVTDKHWNYDVKQLVLQLKKLSPPIWWPLNLWQKIMLALIGALVAAAGVWGVVRLTSFLQPDVNAGAPRAGSVDGANVGTGSSGREGGGLQNSSSSYGQQTNTGGSAPVTITPLERRLKQSDIKGDKK